MARKNQPGCPCGCGCQDCAPCKLPFKLFYSLSFAINGGDPYTSASNLVYEGPEPIGTCLWYAQIYMGEPGATIDGSIYVWCKPKHCTAVWLGLSIFAQPALVWFGTWPIACTTNTLSQTDFPLALTSYTCKPLSLAWTSSGFYTVSITLTP